MILRVNFGSDADYRVQSAVKNLIQVELASGSIFYDLHGRPHGGTVRQMMHSILYEGGFIIALGGEDGEAVGNYILNAQGNSPYMSVEELSSPLSKDPNSVQPTEN